MKLLRKIAMAMFVVMLALTVLLGAQISLIPHSVENSAAIVSSFELCANFIEAFKAKNARLPNEAEFEAWKAEHENANHRLQSMRLIQPEHLPADAQRILGSPPANSFALSLWRGEWPEYYAAWSRKTTVDSPTELYTSIGGPFLLCAMSSVALLLFAKGPRKSAHA